MRMATPAAQGSGSAHPTLVIPDELKAKFPELLALLLQSESMNDEERQYWINILPIMTPDQIGNLNTILTNERQQLASIDQKYSKEIERIGQQQLVAQTASERRQRRTERDESEQTTEQTEGRIAEDLLSQIEQSGV